MNFYVYAHINPVTLKPFYIGKGNGRRCKSERRNKFWQNTVKKYGYAIIKLAEGLTNEQAIEIEKQYISKFGLRQNGGCLVNLTLGGEHGRAGYKMPNSEKVKLIARVLGNKNWLGKKHSDGTKEKMAISAAGRIKSEEEKSKLRIANTGLKRSEEIRNKISEGHKGLNPSEETRVKISESKKGVRNPNYGKKTWNFGIPRTEECKRKIRETKAARKANVDKN